jgi:hypothetical protein
VRQSSVIADHIVQLFDSPESVAETVSSFARDGLAEGGCVLLVMSPDHWVLTADLLSNRGIDVEDASGSGRLVVRDRAAVLEAILRHGAPDPALFEQTVGTLVADMHTRGRLSVYGDMVDRLAELGEFRSASALEELWNELRARLPFTLLCGYSSVHFGHPASAPSLGEICGCHSTIRTNPGDILGDYLLRRSYPGAACWIGVG